MTHTPSKISGVLLLACIATIAATTVGVDSAQADEKTNRSDKDKRVFELRIYTANEGKLDALNARFRDHTLKLFERHGMTNIGYWTPIDNKQNQLIYLLAYDSMEAREKSWKAFMADPDWQKAREASEVSGKLVAKVEQRFLAATDYSPEVKPAKAGDRVFELRTYTATEGNMNNLHTRFRDHTRKLFERHGMTNVAYFGLTEKTPDGKAQSGADNTLVYFLAHKSEAAGKASFAAFRLDPEWIKAKGASEAKGSLTTMPDGVKSVYLKPTDYSPLQ